jgi:hypothetical protein
MKHNVAVMKKGTKVTVPTELGFDRVVEVHHTFEAYGIWYAVCEWRDHFGRAEFFIFDGHQIRSIVSEPQDSDSR